MMFLLNGEILMMITQACTDKIKTQRIMVHGFRSKSEWLQYLKFCLFGNYTQNNGNMQCFLIAVKVMLELDH
jgi:hypothetical protein